MSRQILVTPNSCYASIALRECPIHMGHVLGYIQAIIKQAPQCMTYELSQFDQDTSV